MHPQGSAAREGGKPEASPRARGLRRLWAWARRRRGPVAGRGEVPIAPGGARVPGPRAGVSRLGRAILMRLAAWRARPVVGVVARLLWLGGTLALGILRPALIPLVAVVWLVVLWPLVLRRGPAGSAGRTRGESARRHTLALRYHGGHPGLPRAGYGVLRVWPDDGAAELSVGRDAVAFPLQTVQAVTLVEGRAMLRTGCRGWLAAVLGRLLAPTLGRYVGLHRHHGEDLAIVDKSRVLWDLQRQGRSCRLVVTGRRGGGEEVYLETLVMLRPLDSWREPGAAGGPRGAATSPPPGIG